MEITSQNLIQLTGRITEAHEEYVTGWGTGHRLIHAIIETKTRFEKINGTKAVNTRPHVLFIWQRHNRNSVDLIKEGNIIKITGEIKDQALVDAYTGRYKSMLRIFVYDFELLGGPKDELVVEDSQAKTYPEEPTKKLLS